MKPTLTEQQQQLLLAFVDQQLSAEETAEATALISNNPLAADFVDHLRLSALPYKEAFKPLLNESIAPIAAFNSEYSKKPKNLTSALSRLSIAASLIVGMLTGYIGATFNAAEADATPSWVAQVANYQQLYVRPTVDSAGPVDRPALQAMMNEQLGQQLQIPNLSSKAVEFRRGQLLQVDGQPLIQLAYLPSSGVPMALCIMRDASASPTNHQTGESHGLRYSHWHSQGLRFVLVADVDDSTMQELTEIAKQDLFSS